IFEVFQDIQLLAGERRPKPSGETDEELILIAGWRASDDADSAARMHEGIVRPAHFDQGHDLCPSKNIVGLVRHSSLEDRRSERRVASRENLAGCGQGIEPEKSGRLKTETKDSSASPKNIPPASFDGRAPSIGRCGGAPKDSRHRLESSRAARRRCRRTA